MEETKKNNTVNLDLNTYNNLRDFRSGIEKNHVVSIYRDSWNGEEQIFTTNDAVIEIAKENQRLAKIIRELKNPEKQQPTIDDIKKMSWWQFRKWKRTK